MLRRYEFIYRVALVATFLAIPLVACTGGDGSAGLVVLSSHQDGSGGSFAMLPRPLVSFGAAVSDGWLYVIGGNVAESAHTYSTETASRKFYRLNLRDGKTWEELPGGVGRQSIALVADGGRVYRVGGMEPMNAPGQPADTRSSADFSRFDPGTKQWTELAPLPQPRSSHDAAVLNGKLYVIGGWTLGGPGTDEKWLTTAYSINLESEGSRWQSLPEPPFRSRALAVAAAGDKVFAIGGITPSGAPTNDVHILDTTKGTWSQGPDLPISGGMKGFAASAFGIGQFVYANGIDGKVYRLSSGGGEWEIVHTLAEPRFFHRLVATGKGELLAIGGSQEDGRLRSIEKFRPSGSTGVTTVNYAESVDEERGFDFQDAKESNTISFTLDSLLEPILGIATGVSGTVHFDPAAPAKTTGRIAVQVKSMHVGNTGMKRLMLGHWLDPDDFPLVEFTFKKITDVIDQGDGKYLLMTTGDFSCHGVTREISVPVEATFLAGRLSDRTKDVEGDLLVLRAKFSIKRSDYDIYPGTALDTVADKIQLDVRIVGARPADTH